MRYAPFNSQALISHALTLLLMFVMPDAEAATPRQVPGSVNVPSSAVSQQFGQDKSTLSESEAGDMLDRTFTLTSVLFNQTSVLDGLQLLPFYEQYLGMPVTIDSLRIICHSIMAEYASRGYQQASCTIPEQQIENGIVRIIITESAITRVRLSGDPVSRDSVIHDYLKHIALNQQLDEDTLVWVSHLINAIAGVQATVSIQPIDDSKELEVVFDIQYKHYGIEAAINNRGTAPVGENQAELSLYAYSRLGMDEYLNLYMLTTEQTEELRYIQLDTAWPTGDSGDSIVFDVSHSESMPGDFLASSIIEATANAASIGWESSIILNGSESLVVSSGIEYNDTRVDASGNTLSIEEIYTLNIAANYRLYSPSTYTQYSFTATHGLDSLNTSQERAGSTLVANGNDEFDYLRIGWYHKRALSAAWLWSAELDGQYAFDTLPVSHTVAYGADYSAVAYDPAEFIGDHGLSLQTRLDHVLGNINAMRSGIYAIYDVVRVWGAKNNYRDSAASAAIGFRLQYQGLALDIKYTQAITQAIALEGNDDARVFTELSYSW